MDIEYLDEFRDLEEKDTFRSQQWFGERQRLVEDYSWAIPTSEVIEYCANFSERLLEVGAGNGYWAHLIEEAGGSVYAIDVDPPEDKYTHVREANVRNYIHKLSDYPVLMVWPPHNEGMTRTVIRRRPDNILYVGEQRGGCTADEMFFDVIDSEYAIVKYIELPSYEGVHDNFYHLAKKSTL